MRIGLFRHVASLEARTRLSYRGDFWLNALVSFFADFGLVYFLWDAMFRESGRDVIAGYTFDGMVFYYLSVILLGKLVRGARFEGAVSHDIYEGGLNRYLVYPVSYLPFKYAQRVGVMLPSLLQFVLFAGLGALLLDFSLVAAPAWDGALRCALTVLLAHLLWFLMDYPLHLVAFWADNVWSLDAARWFVASLLGGYMVPLAVFPEGVQTALAYLPFRLFFDFPARALVGDIGWAEWGRGMALGVFWCLVFFALGRFVWRRGQLKYTGVGI